MADPVLCCGGAGSSGTGESACGEAACPPLPAPPVRNSAATNIEGVVNSEGLPASPGGGAAPVAKVVRRVKAVAKRRIPDDIVNNDALNAAIAILPRNYNFEIHKTVWRLRTEAAQTVALQFPEVCAQCVWPRVRYVCRMFCTC